MQISHLLTIHMEHFPFLACRKREMLHMTSKKIEIYLWKIGFVDCKWTNCPLFPACRKRKILHLTYKKVKI